MSHVRERQLGDTAYQPLWAELDARAAVLFIHPDAPPTPMLEGMPSPLPDFPFVPEEPGALLDAVLDGYEDFAQGQLDAINHGSAKSLFPRLAGA
ncbi:hypothetical protein AB0D38_29830 [Streptomyces sp. NPDC048279]|uniref:hypothetical protein n=1 Tax=Streptomyces sp. NPDC048279 TaxID=3154714 RepID=UPI003431228D